MLSRLIVNSKGSKWSKSPLLLFLLLFIFSCSLVNNHQQASKKVNGDYSDLIQNNIDFFINTSNYVSLIFLNRNNEIELYCGPPEKRQVLLDKVINEKGTNNDNNTIRNNSIYKCQKDEQVIDYIQTNIASNIIYALSKKDSFNIVEFRIVK